MKVRLCRFFLIAIFFLSFFFCFTAEATILDDLAVSVVKQINSSNLLNNIPEFNLVCNADQNKVKERLKSAFKTALTSEKNPFQLSDNANIEIVANIKEDKGLLWWVIPYKKICVNAFARSNCCIIWSSKPVESQEFLPAIIIGFILILLIPLLWKLIVNFVFSLTKLRRQYQKYFKFFVFPVVFVILASSLITAFLKI